MSMAEQSEQVQVIYNDPPVHCIDVRSTQGDRVLRIRPNARGATIACDGPAVSLTHEDLRNLASALERITR